MAADMRRAAGTAADSSSNAAGLLYERYSRRILAYCLHALRDRGEAEDAVQTTFLQAHRALVRGVMPEHEFAWLHTIAKNVCRAQQRTSARRAVVTGVDLDAFPALGGDADEKELLHGLGDALASMPETQRRALLMREWHGLSSAEVASRLGMSPPATYALLTRARRSLADALTTAKGRSALGLNVWPLLLRLKAYVAGGAAKIATATAVTVVVAAGGVTIDQALADRSNGGGPSVDEQSGPSGAPTATPISARAASASSQPASSARGGERSREPAPTRDGDVAAPAPGQPDATDAPIPATPTTEPEVPAEKTEAAGTPVVEETLEPVLDPVLDPLAELPLPEVDLGGITEAVPEVVPELPPVEDTGLPPVRVLPLPELPPLRP